MSSFARVDVESLRKVLTVIGIGVVYVDENRRVECNSMALSLLGCSGTAELGAFCDEGRLWDAGAKAPLPRELHPLWRASHRAESVEVMVEREDEGGHRICLQISGWPLIGGDEFQGRAVCVVCDVSNEVWAAEEIARAQEESLASARQKLSFLETISHELRTPLCGMLGNAELLSMSQLRAEDLQSVNTIRELGTTLNGIIDDMLSYARRLDAVDEVCAGPCDVRKIVRACRDKFSYPAEAKGLAVEWKVESSIPTSIVADERRLHRVIENLIGNAIKFTKRGTVTVSVSLASSGGGSKLRVSVRDTGMGIDAFDQYSVFQPFLQVDSTSARKFGGLGLGLALCKSSVELMGGILSVESELNKGAHFFFEIPIMADDENKKESAIA